MPVEDVCICSRCFKSDDCLLLRVYTRCSLPHGPRLHVQHAYYDNLHGFDCRAEKFGIALKPNAVELRTAQPGPLRDELRKERLQKKGVMPTGFDLYSEEERAKQNKRSSRFGTSTPAEGIAIARLSEDEQAKKNRAKKFGLQYEEAERSGV